MLNNQRLILVEYTHISRSYMISYDSISENGICCLSHLRSEACKAAMALPDLLGGGLGDPLDLHESIGFNGIQ